VKIGRDAEVHVAPKTRSKQLPNGASEGRSVQSVGGRSTTSTARNESIPSKAVFLRGLHRTLASAWFDENEELEKDTGLKVWVDWSVITSEDLRGITWVWISIVRPFGLQAPLDSQQQAQQNTTEAQGAFKPASRIVAQICPWEDAPDSRHVALSSLLCSLLDVKNAIGETVRIEAAPPQIPKSTFKTMKIFPFAVPVDQQKSGFKFGGTSKALREEAARRIQAMYGEGKDGNGLLQGPLTDGMILPILQSADRESTWEGAIVKLDPPPGPPLDPAKTTRGWVHGAKRKLNIEVMAEAPMPPSASLGWSVGESLPAVTPPMVGIDFMIEQLHSHMLHVSSTLLTGGIGSGKTSLAQLLAHRLGHESLFSTTYFPCRSLVTEETRVSMVKETLNRVFALAAWGVRLGGHALVILDDLDRLCPVETELEVSANDRSRHISEVLISMVKKYCSMGSRVVLLATAQSKDSVNRVIIGGHAVREIMKLNAPGKEGRRRVLDMLVHQTAEKQTGRLDIKTLDRQSVSGEGWMAGSSPESKPIANYTRQDPTSSARPTSNQSNGFQVDPLIDFLDLAGRTDGYMPGDLSLLVTRARSEALIRTISGTSTSTSASPINLTDPDFTAALKGFTPSSLHNVTLQHSTTMFSSIGGLRSTRQTLLETLQYPTLYAPIFARCPLRLRSGLLLYGYPGCGKTLLASAVAGECGLNFISVKGPEILNKYIGASEKSVRDLFERAQAARPCVLFFDEFDSVAPKRGHDSTGVTDRVVNQLLTQMDGAEGLSGVYVLAATSRPDMIDPALLRPGRLDKSLLCDMPNQDDRLDILQALSKKLRLSATVLSTGFAHHNLEEVARRTDGYSGADLQAVIYNAQLEAIHDVLGDRNSPSKPSRNDSPTANGQTSPPPDFTYFRYGTDPAADDDDGTNPPISASAAATERASIAAQLSTHRRNQQRARAARHAYLSSSNNQQPLSAQEKREAEGSKEPTIQWTHIEKALAQTRASISREEKGRLARIYREFVVGRNGEMSDGQGGSEVGGRSSLM